MTHSKHRRSYTLRTDVSHNTTLGRLLTTNMLQRKMRSKKIKVRTDRTRKELLFLPMQIRVDSSCRGRGAATNTKRGAGKCVRDRDPAGDSRRHWRIAAG